MTMKFGKEKEAALQLSIAMKNGDENEIKQAWTDFHASVVEQIKYDFAEVQASNDTAVLAQRGYRQLTSKEKAFYQKLIEAGRSETPKQAFVNIIGQAIEDDLMPETILADVYKNLEEQHPLISAINFTYTGYATKWILNDHTAQTAVWGQITETITKEITSAFRVVSIDQNKLSAYAIIEKGMLDLGPTFLDAYIRRVLYEALAVGLEKAIISGDGDNQPIGLDRDIHVGVSVSGSKYPQKTAGQGKYTVTEFTPVEYGKLVAALAKTEKGKQRTIQDLTMICSPTDYYTKIMPATTVLTTDGRYVNDLFPVPTSVIQSAQITEGEAILFLPGEYNMFAGANKKGTIEYSDEYKFLEDQRVFKIKTYATGRAFDNTSALLLDISGLKPGYVNVAIAGQVTTTAGLQA